MGTHPIFESDFDCLTEKSELKMESGESHCGENRPPGYIVVKEEFEDEPLELELEEDGNLRMSTLISQFSGACGLRFRNKYTGAMRGVRLNNDLFLPPNGAAGWPTDVTFNVVYSKDTQRDVKRKILEPPTQEGSKNSLQPAKRQAQKPSDLAVLSIPWKTTEDELKNYFSKFGAVVFTNIKKDPNTGDSRGFGFIRFETYESQKKAMDEQNHQIQGRSVVLRLTKKGDLNCQFRKVFVGRLSTELTRSDLMDYFSQFGTITDITIPQPFRSFAFITFQESSDAISILDQDHLIKGISVVTRSADPIQDNSSKTNNRNQGNVYYQSGGQSPSRNQSLPNHYRSSPGIIAQTAPQNGITHPPSQELIKAAVNQAMQHLVGQMSNTYPKREESFYPTHHSPNQAGGQSPIHSTVYGVNQSPVSLHQNPTSVTGVTHRGSHRDSLKSGTRSYGWNQTATSPDPWESSDPQTKNYADRQSWL